MKVWIVFTEREWDWQTHKTVDSVHATEASADARLSQLGRDCDSEEFEVTASDAAVAHDDLP
jgi:hypothetical protein